MPEPIITGAVVTAAAKAAASEAGKDSASLLKRLLGPSVDEFGQALARSVAYRTRNFGRIAEKADRKATSMPADGIVSYRLAYQMLEEGSLCDDELTAEYLGGLLAASRSPGGRDDRAASWCRIVSGMSTFQIRAHFILYREWAERLHDMPDISIRIQHGTATMHAELHEFASVMRGDSPISEDDALQDGINGLDAASLIGDYAVGPRRGELSDSEFAETVRVLPSFRGLELYGWAQGLPGLLTEDFTTKAVVFETDPPVPRLTRVSLPYYTTPGS